MFSRLSSNLKKKAARSGNAWNKLDPNKEKNTFLENTTSRKHILDNGRGTSIWDKKETQAEWKKNN